jgi:hypothetical protein
MGGWSTPRPGRFTPGKDPVPIVYEAGWAPGSVWRGAENLAPTRIRSPDRPARSASLYRLRYPARSKQCTSNTGQTGCVTPHLAVNEYNADQIFSHIFTCFTYPEFQNTPNSKMDSFRQAHSLLTADILHSFKILRLDYIYFHYFRANKRHDIIIRLLMLRMDISRKETNKQGDVLEDFVERNRRWKGGGGEKQRERKQRS